MRCAHKRPLLPQIATLLPEQKQGAIILGIGGDNTRVGVGTFYEGVIARGYTTDAVDDALQRNVVAAGYGLL